MHTGNYHNPIGFYLEEEALRETSYARPSCFRMHRLKGERTSRDDLYSGIHRQSKPHAKVRVNAYVPGERLPSGLHPPLRYPDDRQLHCFLNRPALTCSQGITSSALRSYWPRR